jgi:hypothetical protein
MIPLLIILTTVLLAPNELRPDQMLVVDQASLGPLSTYSQALQLERGWNLVSWYVWPVGSELDLPYMDDIFKSETVPPEEWWFDYGQTDITDMVGRYDQNGDPQTGPIVVYPLNGFYNDPAGEWRWFMNQAYSVYMDSIEGQAHFWECVNQPDYDQEAFDIDPSHAWGGSKYWFFLGYPLRMEYQIHDQLSIISPTIQSLVNDPENPLKILLDDEGHYFDPNADGFGSLRYLEPGKGYRAGFNLDRPLDDECLGFVPEQGYEPAMAPPSPPGKGDQSQVASSGNSHFTFKSRTQWCYPIVIDSVNLGTTPLESGDAIGVFDGDLCVGATAYCDTFPLIITAWKDDIATQETVDGYQEGHEMIFVWYDQSENQEITFTPPPGIQAIEPDPDHPTHSGFGAGFVAHRNMINGVQSVSQLPKEFKLHQNYPNPFNSETIIPLELPQRSQVKIELFNVRGQSLGEVFDGVENAGWPKICYNASHLASGIYFYKVEIQGLERSGKYQSVGKMLLLK